MIRYIVRRLYYGLLVLWGVASVVFILFNVLPGDPARMMMGQRADQAAIDAVRKELGLDQPLPIQYLNYLNDLSPLSVHQTTNQTGSWYFHAKKYAASARLFSVSDFVVVVKMPYLRQSYQSKRQVHDVLAEAFPKTFVLALSSIAFAMLLGIVIGSVAAVVNRAYLNRIILVITSLGMSLPSFFAAILMAWIFAWLLADFTGLSMFGSLYAVDDYGSGEQLALKNLILPALTLGIRPLAIVTELTRTSLIDVLTQDYIRTAKAKGLGRMSIVLKHALRNALNPVITAVSGWFASLLAGAVFVEYVFDWKGVGVVIVDALEKYDLPVLMGSVLMIAVFLIIINIFVDIIYGVLDPRVRLA